MNNTWFVLQFDGSMEMHIHEADTVWRLFTKAKLNLKSVTEVPVCFPEFPDPGKRGKAVQHHSPRYCTTLKACHVCVATFSLSSLVCPPHLRQTLSVQTFNVAAAHRRPVGPTVE